MSANLQTGRFTALNVTSSDLNNIKFDWQGNFSTTNKTFTMISKGSIKLDGDSASRFRTSSGDLTLSSENASVVINSNEAVLDSIYLNASNSAGGIHLSSGTNGIKSSSTGDISLISSGSDINIGLPDDDFDTVNVNNLTRNIQLEATSTISMNSDDFQVLASDSISIISIGNDIIMGDSVTSPTLRISGGDLSIGSSSSTSETKFLVNVSQSSTQKTGYDGIMIKSSSSSITPELTIKNSSDTGRMVMGVEAPSSTSAVHQKYFAFKSGTNIVKLNGPEFTSKDIGRVFYWATSDVSETITDTGTYISSSSLISNSSLTSTHTLTTGGTYTGSTTKYYTVEIDAAHTTPNKFKWSSNGGKTFSGQYINITTSAITLENGITVTFAETTGYTLGDYFTFFATPTAVVASSTAYSLQEAYTLQYNVTYLLTETATDLKLGTASNDRLRITADGNIGINTAQPTSTLQVTNKVRDKLVVNTTTSGHQIHPNVGMLINGGYVIVWESQNSAGTNYDIYGQIYYADGQKNGTEFVINNTTSNNQSFPHVVGNRNTTYGGFMVVWASEESSDTGIYDIKGQIFDETLSDGNRALKSFDLEINQSTSYNQKYPRVASLTTGDYVVVWESDDANTGNSNIYAQKVTRLGNLSGAETQVNTTTTYSQNYPYITSLSADDATVPSGFVVAYMSEYDDDGSSDIKYRIFQSDMTAYNGTEISVTSGTKKTHGRVTCLGLDEGGFLITYFKSYFADTGNFTIGETITSSDGTTAVVVGVNSSYPNKLHVGTLSVNGLFHTGSTITGALSGNTEEIESFSTTSSIFTLGSGEQELTLSNNIINLSLHKYVTSSSTASFSITNVNTTSLIDFNKQLTASPTDYTRDYTLFDHKRPIPSMCQLNSTTAIVTWNNGYLPSIYYQKINLSSGSLSGTEQQINSDWKGMSQRNPSTININNRDKLNMGYVITWQVESIDTSKEGIYMMKFDDNHLIHAGNGEFDWTVGNDGHMGLGITSPATQMHLKSASPYMTLQSNKTEKGSTLSDSKILMSDGDSVQLAEIKACYSSWYDTPYPASNNLVLWYKFEETSGMSTTDHSNQTNTGVLRNFNIKTHRVDGKIKKGLLFDNVDAYIDCGNGSSITGIGSGSFTISMWIKFPLYPPSDTYDLISNGGTTNAGSYIFYISSSSVLVGTLYTSGGAQTATASTAINDDSWHHVALVCDSSGTTLTIYLDGSSDGSASISGSLSSYTSSNVYVGSRDASNNFFMGVIDSVKVYNTNLSATQITELYNNTNLVKGRLILKTNDGTSSFSDTINNVTIDDKSNFRTLRVRGEPIQNITGSLSVSGSTTVTGTSTSFTSELMVGDQLYIDDTVATVVSIASDTSLTIDSSITKSDSTPQKYPSIMCVKDVDDTIQLMLDRSGKLGIGESNPSTQVHISGTTPYLTLENTTSETTDGGRESKITFKGLNSSTRHDMGQIEVNHDGTSADTQGKMIFSTNTGSALTAAMTIDSDGHVYIGSTYGSSNALLEVNSALDTECSVIISNRVTNSDGIGERASHLYFINDQASGGDTVLDEAGYGKIMGSSDTNNQDTVGRLDFYTNNDSTMLPYLSIKSNGKVGIGGVNEPVNNIHMATVQYQEGTASQSTTTVTGVGVNFSSIVVGSVIVFNDHTSAVITAVPTSTTLTVGTSQSVSSQTYKIYYPGVSVSSTSKMTVGTTTTHPSQLHVEGTIGSKVTTVTTDTTLDDTYNVVLVNVGTTSTITLPAAASSDGMNYIIKNITSNNVTIDGNGSETIDGATTVTISSQWGFRHIVCNGTAWFIIATG